MALTTAARVDEFVTSLGVNTHLNYADGTYANYANVITDLTYLGIHQLRDATPDPNGAVAYQHHVIATNAVAAAGNRFDFITAPGQPLPTTLAQIDAIAKAYPGAIIAVEGPNETNNSAVTYNGLTGSAAAIAYQKDLYAAVHADQSLSAANVYYYTGLDVAASIAGLADFANGHPYARNGLQPSASIESEFTQHFQMTPPYPKVITESGYFDVPAANNGVDDATQAKNTLNLILDGFSQGASITYIYQLLSAYPDNLEDTQYGLFRLDNSPKPVATAIHNLTSILSDAGGTHFQPGQLDYAVCGLPENGNTLLMQKSDSAFDLVVWAEPLNWDNTKHSAINVTPNDVTVRLGANYQAVKIYDPMLSDSPIQTLGDVSSVQLEVTDHPLIIEIDSTTLAGRGTQPTSPTFITGPSVGSGDHELVLYLSEDEFQNGGQAQIAVNGNPLCELSEPITASHSAGQQETVTVKGDWLTPPTVDVTFANDACPAGFALPSPKLYLDGATYDGAKVPATYNFYGSGTYSFAASPTGGSVVAAAEGSR